MSDDKPKKVVELYGGPLDGTFVSIPAETVTFEGEEDRHGQEAETVYIYRASLSDLDRFDWAGYGHV